jgi:hypothetical protein
MPSRLADRGHNLTSRIGERSSASAPVGVVVRPFDQAQALQLCQLPAYGRVVASDQLRESGHRQGPLHPQPHQQGEQGAVQANSCRAQQKVVPPRAIEKPGQVEQGVGERVHIACILHLYVSLGLLHIACMIHVSNVLVIIGSIRPRRICPTVAAWVAEIGRGLGPWVLELIDLRDWPLPMDDEPEMPQHGAYANADTKAWSAKVAAADAVVFVTPQYNWDIPPASRTPSTTFTANGQASRP